MASQLITGLLSLTFAFMILVGGLAWANRSKFPKRMQGGGGHATEQQESGNERD